MQQKTLSTLFYLNNCVLRNKPCLNFEKLITLNETTTIMQCKTEDCARTVKLPEASDYTPKIEGRD